MMEQRRHTGRHHHHRRHCRGSITRNQHTMCSVEMLFNNPFDERELYMEIWKGSRGCEWLMVNDGDMRVV